MTFHAVKTDQALGRRSDAIAALTVGWATPAHIVARSEAGVITLVDLKGKRVSLGLAESGDRFCSNILFSHFGLRPDEMSEALLDLNPSLADLMNDRLDVHVSWRGVPLPDLAQAFASGRVRLIALDADSIRGLRVKHPFLLPYTIPARVYPNQEQSVQTVSGRILLLASKSLPAEVVYQVMTAIASHIPDLIGKSSCGIRDHRQENADDRRRSADRAAPRRRALLSVTFVEISGQPSILRDPRRRQARAV